MLKRLLGFLLVAALFTTQAFAAQNVANTSQKGSLLIFPLIDVRTADTATTIVDISNDSNGYIFLNCYYINDHKGRVDFSFAMTPKGSVSWDVLTHSGNIAPPAWPTGGSFPQGNANVGELICFAVNGAGSAQVRNNHLTGVATVVYFNDKDAQQTKQAFKYNAWAFTARTSTLDVIPPADGTPVGAPGDLVLNGANSDGVYDACPLYLIGNFSPGGVNLLGRPNVLGGVTYIDNDLSVSSCAQDLRQDFVPKLTKIQFTVWNEFEEDFTGAWQCSDSVLTFGLDDPKDEVPVNSDLINFTYGQLQTHNARFMAQGVHSTQCPGSVRAGLLGVLTTSIGIGIPAAGVANEAAEIGNTIHGAGTEAGFVLWDPAQVTPPQGAGKR